MNEEQIKKKLRFNFIVETVILIIIILSDIGLGILANSLGAQAMGFLIPWGLFNMLCLTFIQIGVIYEFIITLKKGYYHIYKRFYYMSIVLILCINIPWFLFMGVIQI